MSDEQMREQAARVQAKAPSMDIPVEECVTIGPLDPCAIVIFGASGDLTARKLCQQNIHESRRVQGKTPNQLCGHGEW
jgi:hypothetical protein